MGLASAERKKTQKRVIDLSKYAYALLYPNIGRRWLQRIMLERVRKKIRAISGYFTLFPNRYISVSTLGNIEGETAHTISPSAMIFLYVMITSPVCFNSIATLRPLHRWVICILFFHFSCVYIFTSYCDTRPHLDRQPDVLPCTSVACTRTSATLPGVICSDLTAYDHEPVNFE